MKSTQLDIKEAQKHLDRAKRGGYLIPVSQPKRRIVRWARHIAQRVRNAGNLEELHCGVSPSTKTGDYSDVYVVTPYGNIPWVPQQCEVMIGGELKKGVYSVSRISDKEMHEYMIAVEKAVEFALREYEGSRDDKFINKVLEATLFGPYGVSWNDPRLDKSS